jgi:bidirectional [NiFe] hydrogenase diaphorase subunit
MRRPEARATVPVTIDGRQVKAVDGERILDLARREGVPIPTLCDLEGLSVHGGCRLCLVELGDSSRLQPACGTEVSDDLQIRTDSPTLRDHRRRVVELLFAEGNHVCSVCVSNGACELQDLATATGVDHIHYELEHPQHDVDATHPLFSLDRDRCVLCTRCVRVCAEIEGAAVWEIAHRGAESRLIAEMDVPWGEATSCTSCGKCVQVCPTGALSHRGSAAGEMRHDPQVAAFLTRAREHGEWIDRGGPGGPGVSDADSSQAGAE